MGSKKKASKKKKRQRLLLITAGVLLVCTAGAYVLNAQLYKQKFMPGIRVNGRPVGDYGVAELKEELEAEKQDFDLTIRFLNDQEEKIAGKDLKIEYNCEDELQMIVDSQNRYYWIAGVMGTEAPFRLETEVTFDEAKLRSIIESFPEVRTESMVRPQDAKLVCKPDMTFDIIPEINGNEIDVDMLYDAVCEAIRTGDQKLNAVTADGIYVQPKVRSTDQSILDKRDELNAFLNKTVKINMSDGTQKVLDRQTLVEWLSQTQENLYDLDESYIREKCAEYTKALAAEDDNYGYFRDFRSTNYGTVKLATDNLHGHKMDQKAVAESIFDALMSKEEKEVSLTYKVEVDKKDPRFGGTYVEVDIWSQHVYFYINGDLYCDGPCVTGTEGSHSTPSGIFEIIDLERGRNLEGYNSDGSLSYSAYVNFWMSFYPHYGLHDASWRDSFGGEIYTYNGSHGCVNLSYSTASAIYDAIDYGTPVIVFRGSDDVVIPEDEIPMDTEDRIND